MPLVYSFYPEEYIDSISSKFQFSGWRMFTVDPLKDAFLYFIVIG